MHGSLTPEWRRFIHDRLRSPGTQRIADNTIPIPYVGNLPGAEVAVFLDQPGPREYSTFTDPEPPTRNPLPTLTEVGASSIATLTDAQCDQVIDRMDTFFDAGNFLGDWWVRLRYFLRGMGADFTTGKSCGFYSVPVLTTPYLLGPEMQGTPVESARPIIDEFGIGQWPLALPQYALILTDGPFGNMALSPYIDPQHIFTITYEELEIWGFRAEHQNRPIWLASTNRSLEMLTDVTHLNMYLLGNQLRAALKQHGYEPRQ